MKLMIFLTHCLRTLQEIWNVFLNWEKKMGRIFFFIPPSNLHWLISASWMAHLLSDRHVSIEEKSPKKKERSLPRHTFDRSPIFQTPKRSPAPDWLPHKGFQILSSFFYTGPGVFYKESILFLKSKIPPLTSIHPSPFLRPRGSSSTRIKGY